MSYDSLVYNDRRERRHFFCNESSLASKVRGGKDVASSASMDPRTGYGSHPGWWGRVWKCSGHELGSGQYPYSRPWGEQRGDDYRPAHISPHAQHDTGPDRQDRISDHDG